MALFSSSKDLFELIPRGDGGGAASTAVTRPVDKGALLEIGGATIVIVDEWPEEVEVGRPTTMTVRKDTAAVLGVTAAVLVGLAFFAGRATVKAGPAAPAPQARSLPAGVFDPAQPEAPSQAAPQEAGPQVSSAPRAQPASRRRMNPAATHEMRVVTTQESKARRVIEYLNGDPRSPLAGRPDLVAFAKGSGRNTQVRIGGFVGEDAAVGAKVRAMKDPTGGGNFRGAGFFKASRR